MRQRSLQRQGAQRDHLAVDRGAWSSWPGRSDNRAGEKESSEANLKPGLRKCREHIKRNGGRYRIRTYDFHRVRMALYR